MIYFNYRHFQTIQTILKHKLCVNIHDWSLCVNIIFGDIFQKIFQFMCIYSMIRPLCYAIKFGKNAFNKSIKLSASSKIRHFDPIFGINI